MLDHIDAGARSRRLSRPGPIRRGLVGATKGFLIAVAIVAVCRVAPDALIIGGLFMGLLYEASKT